MTSEPVDALPGGNEVVIRASLARHLAFSPVAFAVTEGPAHEIRYANAAFRQLQSDGKIAIGLHQSEGEEPIADLTPLLDRVFHEAETVRDELLAPADGGEARWSCTVWPLDTENDGHPEALVMEVRDAAYLEGALARQRAIAERLLLGALREQDAARDAAEEGRRKAFLASASRDLAMSLDLEETREIVRGRALPRDGTWCIVDIIESNGAIQRLAVVHPDPAKQDLARTLADRWDPQPDDSIGTLSVAPPGGAEPLIITHDSGAALVEVAHGPENLATLRAMGFGSMLVVPLVVRAGLLGAMTFVTKEDDPPFSAEEVALASDLADRCAMALDNARLYTEADALRATADEANRAKSDFLGNMSHELRTPLNAIGGYAELMELELRGPITPEQRSDLLRIKSSQRHLLALISEILNFVRTESGRMEYRFAEVSVQAAMDDVADLIDGLVKEKKLELDRRWGETDVMVWADPNRFRQILMNLAMNAVKYTPVGGGTISISATATADTVLVQLIDAGIGIPSEKFEAIFEPFVQLANGLTNRTGGVGLGLAISRDLARAMNGDLTVDSIVGVGSRFTLTLPRARQDITPP